MKKSDKKKGSLATGYLHNFGKTGVKNTRTYLKNLRNWKNITVLYARLIPKTISDFRGMWCCSKNGFYNRIQEAKFDVRGGRFLKHLFVIDKKSKKYNSVIVTLGSESNFRFWSFWCFERMC